MVGNLEKRNMDWSGMITNTFDLTEYRRALQDKHDMFTPLTMHHDNERENVVKAYTLIDHTNSLIDVVIDYDGVVTITSDFLNQSYKLYDNLDLVIVNVFAHFSVDKEKRVFSACWTVDFESGQSVNDSRVIVIDEDAVESSDYDSLDDGKPSIALQSGSGSSHLVAAATLSNDGLDVLTYETDFITGVSSIRHYRGE